MSEFSSEVELSIHVPDRETRNIKQQLEGGLSNIPVGLDARGTGGRSRQPRDPSTGQFEAIEGTEQRLLNQTTILETLADRAQLRNEFLEETVDILDDIEDDADGAGLIGQLTGGRARGQLTTAGAAGAAGGLVQRLGLRGAARGAARAAGPVGLALAGREGIELLDDRFGIRVGQRHAEEHGPLIDRIDVGDLVREQLTLEPSDLIATGIDVTAGQLIDTPAAVGPMHLVDSAVAVGVSDLITDRVAFDPLDIVAGRVDVEPLDIIDSQVTFEPPDVIGDATDIGSRVADAIADGVGGVNFGQLIQERLDVTLDPTFDIDLGDTNVDTNVDDVRDEILDEVDDQIDSLEGRINSIIGR